MQNPMLQKLENNPIKNLYNLVRNSNNPQAILGQMMQQNPRLKEAMDFVQKMDGDPKKAFYELAKQRGVDPETILSQLR